MKTEQEYEVSGKSEYGVSTPGSRINRRKFFKMLGGGIAITFIASDMLSAQIAGIDDGLVDDNSIHAWIHVGENNKVTVYTGKVEVGQNIRTSLAQIVAEELKVPFDTITMVMGDTDLTPFDRGTYGSRSIPYMGPQLRKAAASARELLKEMAADKWKVGKDGLTAEDGAIRNTRTGKSLKFSEIAAGKQLIRGIDDKAEVTPAAGWKICGTSAKKADGVHFVTGKHRFVSDLKLPEMMYGKVLRAPSYKARLRSVDLSRTNSIPGVVSLHDGDFVGVCSADPLSADKALTLIRAEWETVPQPSHADIFEYLVRHAGQPRNTEGQGDITKGLEEARVKTEKTFHVDYIAHAPLETRSAVAQWAGDKLTVWMGTQRPFGVQEELSSAFGIPKEKVRVIMPDTGSGYGGKHSGEAAVEAARLAKKAGKPVKLVWTREEEFTWAYFRPAGVIQVKAGADAGGKLTAWEFHNYNSGGSAIETQYEVGRKRIQYHPVESPLRQGSYRGLAGTANIFARECIMDDLAVDLKIDPLDFRMRNLRNERLRNVLTAGAEAFGWGKRTKEKGRGYGLGCGIEKGGYIATFAEVYVDASGRPTVKRALSAFECGAIVNPEHLKGQILGCLVQGLGGALFEWIDFEDGRIRNPMFSRYRVPRFTDMPEIEVVMVNRTDLPSAGAGEAPIYGIAPAVRNAIADAGGGRRYTLPLIGNEMRRKN